MFTVPSVEVDCMIAPNRYRKILPTFGPYNYDGTQNKNVKVFGFIVIENKVSTYFD